MGFLDKLLGRETRAATIKSSDPYLAEFFGMRESNAGVVVSPHAAENLAAVFACTQAIADMVAALPLKIYRKLENGGRIAETSHPVARLFSGDINDALVAHEFFEMQTAHTLLSGNSYSEIVRDKRGAPTALIPIPPELVSVVRIRSSNRLAYDVSDPMGGPQRRLLADDVLHLRDRSSDGLVGKSRISRAREAVGTAIAAETYAASTFRNGASMSGLVIHPSTLDDAAQERLRQSLTAFKGTSNAGKIGVLEESMKWEALSVSPDDAQALQSRQFNVENICRLFKTPPAIVGHFEGSNYSALVEVHKMFFVHGVAPWLNKWERVIERSLFSEEGRRQFEVEFDTDLILRTSMLERMQAYRIGREIGLYSANDLRKWESLNPRDDAEAESYLSPMNMQSEQTGQPKE